MADETQAEKDAAERVDKAQWINQETYARLHQYDGEQFGVKTTKPAKPAKVAKVADKP